MKNVMVARALARIIDSIINKHAYAEWIDGTIHTAMVCSALCQKNETAPFSASVVSAQASSE